MTEKQCGIFFLAEKEKLYHPVNNWGKCTKWGGGFVSTSCNVEMVLIMAGEEVGAAADILLSRWKQNLNWGMVYSISEQRNN